MGQEVPLGCVSQQEGARALGRFVIGLAPVRTHDLLRADSWIFEQTTCPPRSSPRFLERKAMRPMDCLPTPLPP